MSLWRRTTKRQRTGGGAPFLGLNVYSRREEGAQCRKARAEGVVTKNLFNCAHTIGAPASIPGQNLFERFWRLWCSLTHGKPMHPVMGMYRCRRCLREYPVEWNGTTRPRAMTAGGFVEAER